MVSYRTAQPAASPRHSLTFRADHRSGPCRSNTALRDLHLFALPLSCPELPSDLLFSHRPSRWDPDPTSCLEPRLTALAPRVFSHTDSRRCRGRPRNALLGIVRQARHLFQFITTYRLRAGEPQGCSRPARADHTPQQHDSREASKRIWDVRPRLLRTSFVVRRFGFPSSPAPLECTPSDSHRVTAASHAVNSVRGQRPLDAAQNSP